MTFADGTRISLLMNERRDTSLNPITGAAWVRASLLFAGLLLAGCNGSEFGTVDGSVALNDKPLEGGSVTFYPVGGGPLSYADIASNGSYHLRTATHDGVLPGSYVATVSWRSGLPSPQMTVKEVEALEKVPVKYCSKDTSDLRFSIERGRNSIDLELTTKN